jgi:hypothetical protein
MILVRSRQPQGSRPEDSTCQVVTSCNRRSGRAPDRPCAKDRRARSIANVPLRFAQRPGPASDPRYESSSCRLSPQQDTGPPSMVPWSSVRPRSELQTGARSAGDSSPMSDATSYTDATKKKLRPDKCVKSFWRTIRRTVTSHGSAGGLRQHGIFTRTAKWVGPSFGLGPGRGACTKMVGVLARLHRAHGAAEILRLREGAGETLLVQGRERYAFVCQYLAGPTACAEKVAQQPPPFGSRTGRASARAGAVSRMYDRALRLSGTALGRRCEDRPRRAPRSRFVSLLQSAVTCDPA